MPLFLEGGKISGESVCKASGKTFCPSEMTLGDGICRASNTGSYCPSGMTRGEGICRASGNHYCSSGMRLGQAVCTVGGGLFCSPTLTFAEGVCLSNNISFCSTSTTLGEAICRFGNNGAFCPNIGHDALGEGICRAMNNTNACKNISVHEVICGYTQNCKGYDAASLAVAITEVCGTDILHFGIK